MNITENPLGPHPEEGPEVETSLDCIMVDGKSETDTTVRPARPEVLKHIPPERRRLKDRGKDSKDGDRGSAS
jgi:hypothetical protein